MTKWKNNILTTLHTKNSVQFRISTLGQNFHVFRDDPLINESDSVPVTNGKFYFT